MCGIVGCVSEINATRVLLRGLERLEYRGYDSAGVAVIDGNGDLALRRRVGKLIHLMDAVDREPIQGNVGIGHTRWATHGGVTEPNAHPHLSYDGNIALIHNGIIENYEVLKRDLVGRGRTFHSETDTETLVHRIAEHRESCDSLYEAVRRTLAEVEGAYGIVVIDRREPDTIVCAREQSPLVVGVKEGEAYLASDVPALLDYTRDVIFLEDGDIAVLRPGEISITDHDGNAIERSITRIKWDLSQAEKGGYRHFMLKETHEQPRVLGEIMLGRIDAAAGRVNLVEGGEPVLPEDVASRVDRVVLIACGTSWHAALVGAFWFESFAGLPVQVDYASEFRYRTFHVDERTLVVPVSQSGETADTLAAVKEARRRGAPCVAIVNAVGSSMTREVDGVLYTRAGPEIGVASTKAFTTQLAGLYLLAHALGTMRGTLGGDAARARLEELAGVHDLVARALEQESAIESLAATVQSREDFLYLGRGLNYPVALEGALKLKEISYIHAEGYPAGEMKHGPIALIDDGFPVVCVATPGAVYDKVFNNLEEVRARKGRVIAVGAEGDDRIAGLADDVMWVPGAAEAVAPIVNVVPLQLLAYHVALIRGCDIDQPRNLAKSVTVE